MSMDEEEARIEVGDLVRSMDNGHIGVVKAVYWADEEPYSYGPYIVVVWADIGRPSCWISHHHFKVLGKRKKSP